MQLQKRLRCTSVGLALACFFMVTGPVTGKAVDPVALQTQLEQVQKLQQATAEELKAQNKELQERLKAQETDLLETQRKSIDWWFSLLGVMVGALAVMFGALPLLLTRQQKADIEKELTSAKDLVASIRGHEQQARDTSEKLNSYVSGQPQSAAQQDEINREIASIQRSSTATDTDKLRARAIQASEGSPTTAAQALKAFDLWKAVTLIAPEDASAHFNAAYWAHELYEFAAQPSKAHWFDALASFYGQAVLIKPDMDDAANNWGIALGNEAQAVAAQDLGAARVLWQQAGDKFAQALKIKSDNHETATNWGVALEHEAQAVAAEDLGAAHALWQQAGEKYALALKIQPDKHEAANNWGIALGAEAQAVAAQDLGAARALWQQAGEKYAQALKIKPDKHEAASNWGNALSKEAQALLAHQLRDDADQVLIRAANLLEQRMAAWPDAQGQLAYNLACVYCLQRRATHAVAQLEAARQAEQLPDHWRTDPDLNPIRTSADYQAWVAQHFPNPIPTDTNASKGT